MTRWRRTVRAAHAGLVFWLFNSLLGLLVVSIIPARYVLRDISVQALLIHHLPLIIAANALSAVFVFALVDVLLEYQHKLDQRGGECGKTESGSVG